MVKLLLLLKNLINFFKLIFQLSQQATECSFLQNIASFISLWYLSIWSQNKADYCYSPQRPSWEREIMYGQLYTFDICKDDDTKVLAKLAVSQYK